MSWPSSCVGKAYRTQAGLALGRVQRPSNRDSPGHFIFSERQHFKKKGQRGNIKLVLSFGCLHS